VKDPKPNNKLQTAREQKMWSLEEAARQVGVDVQTLWRWEMSIQRPRPYSLRLLCEAYGLSPEELGFGKSSSDDRTPDELEPEDTSDQSGFVRLTREQAQWVANLLALGDHTMFDPTKRMFLMETLKKAGVALTAAGAASLLIDPEPWERLSLAVTKPATLNQQTLNHFRDLMRVTWEFSNGSELDVAERMLPQFLPRLIQVAPHQPEAAILASQGLQLHSILVAHKLKISQKIALCQQAVSYARGTQDSNTLVAALLQLAVAYNYDSQYDNALKSYQEALIYCDQATPLLRSRTYIEAAATFAHYRRAREADFYLDLAQEAFPADPASDPAYLYADHNSGVLALYHGLIYLERGDTTRAWTGFESFQRFGPTPERIRLEIVNQEGRAALLEQDLEKYASCLEDGLSGAVRLGSRKRYDEAVGIYRSIPTTWAAHPCIALIADQYQLQHSRTL
jgi:transcriptional regulator with XRE-family HTH domain/tetratricopeptide (TPR) repeat protein